MSKDEFNKLSNSDQIKYINDKLLDGLTLTIICENVGISKSTISTRLRKAGYIFDRKIKQYIVLNNDISSNEIKVEDENINRSITRSYNKNNYVSNLPTHHNTKQNYLVLNNNDSYQLFYLLKNIEVLNNVLEKNINIVRNVSEENIHILNNILEEKIDMLDDILEKNIYNESEDKINNIDDMINNIYEFKKEQRYYKLKTLKIDSKLFNSLEEIFKDLGSKGISQHDVINYIFKEYIEFYNDITE